MVPISETKTKKRSIATVVTESAPLALGLIWLVVAFFPVYYVVITSFHSRQGFLSGIPWLPPAEPTAQSYVTIWNSGMGIFFLNSVFVTGVSVLLILAVSLFASYVIARIRARAIVMLFNVFLLGLAIPLQAVIIPLYAMITELGLYDTLFALIPPYVAFGIPLSVLILVNFIRDIPNDLYDSMAIDGAGHVRVLASLVLPLSRPALVTVGIYNAIQVWNGFIFPLVLTQSPNVRVLPLALRSFQGEFTINVPVIMAGVLLSAAPLIVAYIVGRRQLLSGLTAGFSK